MKKLSAKVDQLTDKVEILEKEKIEKEQIEKQRQDEIHLAARAKIMKYEKDEKKKTKLQQNKNNHGKRLLKREKRK